MLEGHQGLEKAALGLSGALQSVGRLARKAAPARGAAGAATKTPSSATLLRSLQHGDDFIPAPKLPAGLTKDITLQGGQSSRAAYQSLHPNLRSAIEQSDLVKAGVPPAVAASLAERSFARVGKRVRGGLARGQSRLVTDSGVPDAVTRAYESYKPGTAKRLGTAASEGASIVGMPSALYKKAEAAQWGAFLDELCRIHAVRSN